MTATARQIEVLRTRLDDAARVQALVRLGVLDQPPSADLDGLTRLATFVSGAPIAMVNLLDATRQWQASVTGGPRGVVRREDSLCQYTVADNAVVHVADASRDQRFADSPFVDGRLGSIRFYCGVPVRDVAGFPVGTLCVTDTAVRELRPQQVAALHDLAAQVEHLFELRRLHDQLVEVLTEVDHFATHDPLTGAVNRRLLMDRLDLAISRAVRSGTAPTVLFCDLDSFKAVNDEHGHQAGDAVLVEVTRRITALLRPSDTVARLGGDAFVLVCEDLPVSDHATVVERLRSAVNTPVLLPSGALVRVATSVGIAGCLPGQCSSDALRVADHEMYVDKLARRSDLR